MSDHPQPPRRNRAGHAIWFVPADGGDGAYAPVTFQGRRAFVLAFAWILLCGLGGMTAFALTWSAWAFVGMFVAAATGLAMFVRAVIRHS